MPITRRQRQRSLKQPGRGQPRFIGQHRLRPGQSGIVARLAERVDRLGMAGLVAQRHRPRQPLLDADRIDHGAPRRARIAATSAAVR